MTTDLQPANYATINSNAGFSPLAGDRAPLEVFADYVIRLFTVALAWNDRARQRHQLGQLSDHLLADIGVSRAAAADEAAKLPWVD